MSPNKFLYNLTYCSGGDFEIATIVTCKLVYGHLGYMNGFFSVSPQCLPPSFRSISHLVQEAFGGHYRYKNSHLRYINISLSKWNLHVAQMHLRTGWGTKPNQFDPPESGVVMKSYL